MSIGIGTVLAIDHSQFSFHVILSPADIYMKIWLLNLNAQNTYKNGVHRYNSNTPVKKTDDCIIAPWLLKWTDSDRDLEWSWKIVPKQWQMHKNIKLIRVVWHLTFSFSIFCNIVIVKWSGLELILRFYAAEVYSEMSEILYLTAYLLYSDLVPGQLPA